MYNKAGKFIAILLGISLVFGQYARLPLFSERIYFFDLMAGVMAFYTCIYICKSWDLKLMFSSFLFIAFTVWAGVSLFRSSITYSYGDFHMQAFYLVRWTFYLFSALGIVQLIKDGVFTYIGLLRFLMFLGFILSLFGFAQLVFIPDFTQLDPQLGWDPHKNRLASTLFDPNFAGAYLVCTITIYLGLVYSGKLVPLANKVQSLAYFLLPLLALILTFSRSAWGMFAIVILIFGILKYRLLLIIFVFMAVAIYFAVPRVQTRLSGITDPADSARFRLISWQNALKVYETSPVFGVGFNSYRYAQKELGFFEAGELGGNAGAGADSSFLFILATTGIIGLVLFLTGYMSAVMQSAKNMKKSGLIPFAILVALFFESVFINSVFYPQLMLLWLVFAQIDHTSSRFDISH